MKSMSKIDKTKLLPAETYSAIYDKLLPKYDKLVKYVSHLWFDTSYTSDMLEDRIQEGYCSLFNGVRSFCQYKVVGASKMPLDELIEVLDTKADAYLKTCIWHVKSGNAKRCAIRHSLGGAMYSLNNLGNSTGNLDSELESIVIERSLLKL